MTSPTIRTTTRRLHSALTTVLLILAGALVLFLVQWPFMH